jgi:hypothetical protein
MRQATTVTIRTSRPPTDRQAYAMPTLGRKLGPRATAVFASRAFEQPGHRP